MYVIVFFFSSRRRHTRCSRDWSSDVCSSDLGAPHVGDRALGGDAEYLRQAETGDGLHEGGAAGRERERQQQLGVVLVDRKSTRLNSSHGYISYAVFCLKKKNNR